MQYLYTHRHFHVLALAVTLLAAGVSSASPAGAQEVGSTRDAQTMLADLLLAEGKTRGDAAEEMIRALETVGIQPPACVDGEEMFDDVPADSNFCPFIEELARHGITSGCGGGNFCPAAKLTRAQMAVFIVRALVVENRGVATFGATVTADGTLLQWFNRAGGEPTVSRNAVGQYTLDVPGIQCNIIDNCIAQVTLIGTHGFANANSGAGNVVVFTADTDGAAADQLFQIVVFEASTEG